MKVWTGSAWAEKPAKVWSGTAWVTKPVKVWDGVQWVIRPPVTAVYTDNFNRANANLEASPVASGGWSWVHDGLIGAAATIQSNQLRCNISNATGSAYTTTLSSPDQYVQYKAVNVTSTGPFVCCRLDDVNNFIGLRAAGSKIEVHRRVGGTFTSLFIGSTTAVNDTVRLETIGSNIFVYKNGALVNGPTAIGATFASPKAGIVMRTIAVTFCDDFECGTL